MILKLQVILIFLYIIITCLGESNLNFIYQKSQMSSLLFNNESLNMLQIKSNENHSIVACGKDGIRWIDNTKISSISTAITSLQNFDQINAIAITLDSNYILTNYQKKLSIFAVNRQDYSLKLVRQATNELAITDIYLTLSEKVAIIIGEKGSVIAYDVQSKQQGGTIQILDQYNSSTNILGFIFISPDNNWLFIADQFAGVTVLRLIPQSNSDGSLSKLKLTKAGSIGQLYFVAQVVVTSDNKYLYAFDRWYGIQIIQLTSIVQADQSTYPITINQKTLFWPYYDMNPVFMGASISADSNYLVVSVRSHGLVMFDIRNRALPVLYYKIQIEGIPIWIEFTPQKQKIFYTDGQKIIVYKRVEPNLNDDFPNVFNGHQSNLNVYTKQYYQWRCYFTPDEKYMISAQCGDLDILKINDKDPYSIHPIIKIPKQGSTRSCNLQFSSDFKYMYQPVNQSGKTIDIYDVQSINENSSSISLLQSTLNNTPQRNEDIRFSNDQSLLVQTFAQGIQIYDSTNMLSLTLLSSWQVPSEINGFPCAVGISPDNNWIIIALRNIGSYIVLNIKEKAKPQLANKIVTLGGESVIISQIKNVAYLCDGSKGLAIIDLNYLPEIKEISRIVIDGWANFIQPIQNEKFLVISSMDYGMLTIVNIENLQKPIILSKYQENTQQSFGSCFFKDLSYGFSVSQYGLRIFPMKSSVKIHSSFIDSSKSNNIPQEIEKNTNLLVGQTIELQLLMLYATDGAKIIDVYYYNNFQMNLLPYWISFIRSKNSITISVDKTSINEQNPNEEFLNTLVIKIGLPITEKSFIYDCLPTTPEDSKKIYKYFLDKGFIDGNNIITSAFNPSNSIEFSVVQLSTPQLNQQMYDKVRLTLQKGIFFNPILFKTSSSLKFNTLTQDSMINTLSNNVKFSLTSTSLQTGIFVNKAYSGVIVSLSEEQNQIIFEGPKENVNRILRNQIYFSQFSNEKGKSFNQDQSGVFKIDIDDGINYDVQISLTLKECISSFIKLKSKLTVQQKLQDQLNDKYSNGVVPMLEETTIEFVATSFKDVDEFQLSYSAFLIEDGVSEELKSDYWLKFSSSQLRFSGTAPNQMYKKSVTIMIQATDGYTTVSDTFTIKIETLPFLYILNIALQILTPLVSIIGIYKYRYIIVNHFNFEKTLYSKEIIKANQIYFKIIPLLGDNLHQSREIVKLFFKYLDNQTQQLIHIEEKNDQNMDDQQVNNSAIRIQIERKDSNQMKEELEASVLKQDSKLVQQLKKQTAQKLKQLPQVINQSNIEKIICNSNGIVDMKIVISILKRIQMSYKFQGRKKNLQDDMQELQDTQSLLHICVYSLLTRYILSKQPDLLFFYEYLKKYSLILNFYSQNDWYKNFITLNYTINENEIINLYEVNQRTFLQQFKLKEESLQIAISNLQQQEELGQIKSSHINYQSLNIELLKQVLLSDALGISFQKSFHYKKCLGESLLIDSSNIQSIETYKENIQSKNICCKKSKYYNFSRYGISSNLKLPHWVQLINKKGLIILQGKPTNDDIEDIQIRIIDRKDYIIKTFSLEIQADKEIAKQQDISNNQTTILFQPALQSHLSQNSINVSKSPQMQKFQLTLQKKYQSREYSPSDRLILDSQINDLKQIQIDNYETDFIQNDTNYEDSPRRVYKSYLQKKRIDSIA